MSYVIFGRAIKNEYLSIGTLSLVGGIAWASMRGGNTQAAPVGANKNDLQKVKEAVPLNAGSSEEEEFIRKFIAEAEKESQPSH